MAPKKQKYKVCKNAYTRVEIEGKIGTVTCCCPFFTNDYIFGNIKEEPFQNIWNSEKARDFRQSMLDGNFKFCNMDQCCPEFEYIDDYTTKAEWPKTVEIAVSTKCNVACVMCRDFVIDKTTNTVSKKDLFYDEILSDNEQKEFFLNVLIPRYLEILKHAETLEINHWGEALCDSNCKKLLKEAIKINPKLKIYLLTNGVLCDEKHLKSFGIYNNVDVISISIHAATKETYDKIVKFGDFNKVRNNIEWLSQEMKNGRFSKIIFNFVVQKYNYKEMIDFAKWVKSLGNGFQADFWELRIETEAELTKHFEQHAVFLPEHPEYENLVEILKHPIFKEECCYVSDSLLNLKSNKIK